MQDGSVEVSIATIRTSKRGVREILAVKVLSTLVGQGVVDCFLK